ncbi:MAG: large-conductance mechanosensitive channel protein MscL [Planctomycetes bacterium]|nr:large-conductance mechanosensitive channel protein MscL [Planctomycetota bacterium]
MLAEFRAFALRGNVVDMAVGVIIGGAFGKIVSSLVNDIVMPPIGMLTGGDFSKFTIDLRKGATDGETVAINIGTFLNTVVDFLIVAFVIFLVVRQMNAVVTRFAPKKDAAAPTTKTCAFCCSTIPIAATRCAHCTSELPRS